MIVQPLSFEIIQAIQEVDPYAQIEMLKILDRDKPMLVVTHIHQGTQTDEMEWPLGELIIKANDQEIHTLEELQKVIENSSKKAILLECMSGTIGYFQLEEESEN